MRQAGFSRKRRTALPLRGRVDDAAITPTILIQVEHRLDRIGMIGVPKQLQVPLRVHAYGPPGAQLRLKVLI